MTDNRKPVARLTFRKDRVNYSILSIWRGKFAGTYDVSRDKASDKRQVISLFNALRAWGMDEGYLSVSVESEREPYGSSGGGQQPSQSSESFGGGDFGGDDIPFAHASRGVQQ